MYREKRLIGIVKSQLWLPEKKRLPTKSAKIAKKKDPGDYVKESIDSFTLSSKKTNWKYTGKNILIYSKTFVWAKIHHRGFF